MAVGFRADFCDGGERVYVHFGAGNIGRALAGPVFRQAGWRVLFVDAVPEIARALRERGAYRVVVKEDVPAGEAAFTVSGVDGIDARDAGAVRAAVARADLIGTAVGAARLPDVLAAIAPGLLLRAGRPVSLLFCENLHGVAALARGVLAGCLPPGFPLAEQVGLVETSIGKMVPVMPADVRRRDPLEVWGEAYNVIIADRDGFAGTVPEGIAGLELRTCFQAYVARKLYIHNLGHAACACHGFLRGHALVGDAVADGAVLAETRAVMAESARALAIRYPEALDEASLAAHVEDLLRRFGNRALGDTVFRVGRDLPRKLAPGDRFVGGLRLVQETGCDIAPVCRAIAAALRLAATDEAGQPFPADAEFRRKVAREGAAAVLRTHCGLDPVRDADALRIITAEI
jgi:mannitol-1-phosphate 5-dehydrogenase